MDGAHYSLGKNERCWYEAMSKRFFNVVQPVYVIWVLPLSEHPIYVVHLMDCCEMCCGAISYLLIDILGNWECGGTCLLRAPDKCAQVQSVKSHMFLIK